MNALKKRRLLSGMSIEEFAKDSGIKEEEFLAAEHMHKYVERDGILYPVKEEEGDENTKTIEDDLDTEKNREHLEDAGRYAKSCDGLYQAVSSLLLAYRGEEDNFYDLIDGLRQPSLLYEEEDVEDILLYAYRVLVRRFGKDLEKTKEYLASEEE